MQMRGLTCLILVFVVFAVVCDALSIGTYLFLDDQLIKSSSGLFFEQHQPKKLGQVISPEYEWETGIYFYTSALKVSDSEYRLYYTCIGMDNYRTSTINLCMANSSDGINFQKPFLGVIEYGESGSVENNIVFAVPLGGWPNTVWLDQNPACPPDQMYKLTYDGNDTTRYLRVAASPDGIRWNPIAEPRISNQFADTQTVVVYNVNTGDYVAYGRSDYAPSGEGACPGNAPDYQVNVSEFGPPTTVFSWDPKIDPPCLDPYNPATLLYPTDPFIPSFFPSSNSFSSSSPDVPNVFLLFPSYTYHLINTSSPSNPYIQTKNGSRMTKLRYGKNDNLLDVHFIFSQNGRDFSYVTKEPFIPRGIGYRNMSSGMFDLPNSEWDSGFVFMTRGVFVTPSNPNTLTLYYYGTQMTHTYAACIFNIHNANFTDVAKGLGRAEIRRDGFVSLTTEYNLPMPQASLQTVPITLPDSIDCGENGLELQLNIETSVSGFISVEILDVHGSPIPGYTFNNCVPIKGNFVRVPVIWSSSNGYYSDLSKLAGTEVTLSFSMSHTKLYSMELACSNQNFQK